MPIVLASHNSGKLTEFKQLFAPLRQQIIQLSQFSNQEANEIGITFIENALIKARYACTISRLPALADDSGLCIPALANQPGIYSARFAGANATAEQNIIKLLQILKDSSLANCPACFYCVLALMQTADDPMPVVVCGKWEGIILSEPRGTGGFGYDPIFYIPALGKTAAELTASEKNQYSHRGLAMQHLRKLLS